MVALVRGSDMWVANAGDSRCVASRRGRALALTHDHKPTDSQEMQRIAKVCAAYASCLLCPTLTRLCMSFKVSEAVLVSWQEQALALTPVLKPSDPEEMERIGKVGPVHVSCPFCYTISPSADRIEAAPQARFCLRGVKVPKAPYQGQASSLDELCCCEAACGQ